MIKWEKCENWKQEHRNSKRREEKKEAIQPLLKNKTEPMMLDAYTRKKQVEFH